MGHNLCINNAHNKTSNVRLFFSSVSSPQDENPALCSHEHAMAQVMAYKHLPPSMELPHATPPLSPAAERTFTPLAAHTTI